MTHEINIADFAAFCRSKGGERYEYTEPRECALALFLQVDHPDADVGPEEYSLEGSWEAEQFIIPRKVKDATYAVPRTFSALADRLEALMETADA